jgi:hypothetical protein
LPRRETGRATIGEGCVIHESRLDALADRLTITDLIYHRLAIRDFDEIREVTPLQHHEIGRRDRSDPSYGVLETNL